MIYKTPRLETERLILKRGIQQDYFKVYEYDLTKLRGIAGEFEFVKQDLEKIEGFESYADETEDVFDWIIYLKENGEPIGNIIADRANKQNNSIEISYNLHPNYWGNGYIPEATVEVMRYLFENEFDNIVCGYSEGNIKSKKVIEKIGFEPYKVIKNSWIKNGIPITDYKLIMSKEKYNELYKNKII